jgi:hypothetical protein
VSLRFDKYPALGYNLPVIHRPAGASVFALDGIDENYTMDFFLM